MMQTRRSSDNAKHETARVPPAYGCFANGGEWCFTGRAVGANRKQRRSRALRVLEEGWALLTHSRCLGSV
jgi:hypothetical protein